MSRLSTALDNDVKALRMLRDELFLQSALLKAELKDRWNELETRRDVLNEHIQRAEVAAGDVKGEIEAAASLLVESLRNGYTSIKNALKS